MTKTIRPSYRYFLHDCLWISTWIKLKVRYHLSSAFVTIAKSHQVPHNKSWSHHQHPNRPSGVQCQCVKIVFLTVIYGLIISRKKWNNVCTIIIDCLCIHSMVIIVMMTSSNGNIFHVTGPLCGEFASHRWIPPTKASDAELWCFLWSESEQTVEQTIKRLVISDDISPIMTSLQWFISLIVLHNSQNKHQNNPIVSA